MSTTAGYPGALEDQNAKHPRRLSTRTVLDPGDLIPLRHTV